MASTRRLIDIIKREQPDVVHLHCINNHFVNIYKLVQWLKENRVKTVITNHAEFFYTANCSHAYDCNQWQTGCEHCTNYKQGTKSLFLNRTAESYRKMQEAFAGFCEDAIVTSVSDWVEHRAELSPILAGMKHCTVLNGVDVDVFKLQDASDIYQECRQRGEKVVFHATAHFTDQPGHAKGGWAVLDLAQKFLGEPVRFYVAAGRQEISGSVPENVVFLGNIKDQTLLARHYSMADLTLITSKRETFSMPCAESLCCGTPVVGFKAGAPETIALPDYSEFVEYGNMECLERAIRSWIARSDVDKQQVAGQAVERYSNKKMVQSFLEVYGELV